MSFLFHSFVCSIPLLLLENAYLRQKFLMEYPFKQVDYLTVPHELRNNNQISEAITWNKVWIPI